MKSMSVLAVEPHERGDRASRARQIESHLPLVASLARRYANRGEQIEDLTQVGAIGLINAVDRFDPRRGVDFEAFAVPTIVGEIKRHLRDRASTIRVPRRDQEAAFALRRARRQLASRLARTPSPAELAAAEAIAEDDLPRAVGADRAGAPLSLSVPGADPAVDDSGYAAAEDRLALLTGLRALDPRERRALSLSYVAGLSQREVAVSLGVSQSATSRTIGRAVTKLRSALADDAARFVDNAANA
jgi:RNA polymerase sigma-B factor